MCFFVGYKYGGGGYRVWDPKKRAVVETRDVIFFEGRLPAPLLREAPTPTTPAVERPTPQTPEFDNTPALPAPAPVFPPPLVPSSTPPPLVRLPPASDSPTRVVQPVSTAVDVVSKEPAPRLVLHIPAKANRAPPPPPPPVVSDDDDDDDYDVPTVPTLDVARVPNFPERSLRSGRVRAAGTLRI